LPYKDKDDLRKYQREWLRRKKRGETTRLYPISTEKERKKYILEKGRRYRKKLAGQRQEIDKEVFSPGCFICKREDLRLLRHRKDGQKHDDFSNMSIGRYEQEVKTGEYALLCFRCHEGIHWNMNNLGIGWKEVSKQLGERFKNTRRRIIRHEEKI